METKIKIALLGATGQVGKLYLERVLDDGHSVRALVRDPAKLNKEDKLEIIQGDASNASDVATLVEGVDLIVSCVGGSKGVFIMESTAKNVLAAARTQVTPPKAIFISSLGCSGTSFLIKILSILMGGPKTFADYDKADRLIASENVIPVVLARPTGLNDEPAKGAYSVFRKNVTFAPLLPRADLAQFLFDASFQGTWDGPKGVQLAGVKSV